MLSDTLAKCKMCNRTICHGRSATGNLNRHMKMKHLDIYTNNLLIAGNEDIKASDGE